MSIKRMTGAGMVAGYTVACVTEEQVVKLVTMASKDEAAVDELLVRRFGATQILSRTAVDAWTLSLMKIHPGEWIEWAPVARRS